MLNISKRARLMLDLLFGVSAALALLMALGVGLEMSWGLEGSPSRWRCWRPSVLG
ncbi:MAG: hypothetical protein IPM00_10130 [Tetrasphaera sp.]|nr:hypothetical protein [Tetrasphaera sp.]